jgi:hypothetical protein
LSAVAFRRHKVQAVARSDDDWLDLGALMIPQYADPVGLLRAWAQAFVRSNPTDTLSLLKDVNANIASWISYQSRDDEGTQTQLSQSSRDTGSTHAWAEVYVPGAGWVTFDSTNRNVGGFNLIPVAVARDIHQIMPVTGSFVGKTGALLGMAVEVCVGSRPTPA